ncbi:MAG: leucine-rich repeat domain-containing protein, partial [Clostridia bacterium]|nr:leucine-rich repeat domain-containing protein [Clostridia bacterium]
TNFRSIVTFVDHNYVDGICSMCGQADPDAYTIVSTEQYNGRLTFEVREKADGSHTLVVSGTGVMPTNKQVAGYEFLNYSATTTKVIIEEGVTTVGYGIFNGWTALASVELPFSLTTIDGESFRGCTGLKAIEIPYGVTTLGYGAFWGAGLESVVIPESVTSIKNYVFYRCKSLVSAEIYGTTDYKVGSRIYKAPGARMFSECSKLSNIVLGENINLLNTYCFHGTAITEFTVPARVKFVYDAAFHSCTKMTKFVMEEGVTYLGWAALFGCSSLTDVSLPSTITGGNIATWAFGACTSLESIELPSKLTNLKKRTFSGCTSLKSIELPETVTTLGDRVFIGCTSLTSVKLSNITKIDVQTFNNCPKLTSITIPETVTSIGDLAFRLNSSLKTVYIDSATIAAGLTGNAVYGNMIKWAETIAIRADIENVPSYVTSNYKTVGSVTVDGVEYVTYSK